MLIETNPVIRKENPTGSAKTQSRPLKASITTEWLVIRSASLEIKLGSAPQLHISQIHSMYF